MAIASPPRRRILTALALGGSLLLTACGSGTPSAAPATSGGELRVVTSTTVYSSLVAEVLGDRGEVQALIESSAQDPHSYEASSRDKLRLSKANLVVLNGGGYDAFAEQVVDSLDERPAVLEAYEGEGHTHDHGDEHSDEPAARASATGEGGAEDSESEHDHGNEHVWYDLHLMEEFAGRIGEELATLDPAGADGYRERAAQLATELGGLEERVESLKAAAKGRGYLMTEPVAQSLLEDAGLVNRTPDGLAEAIEEGDEISPLALKRAQDALRSGSVAVLAYNEQTTDEQTALLEATAREAGVHVLKVSETPGAEQDYLSWMGATITALEKALA
ncbi:MAG: zinc ABC transporter substrate-binding protein [Arthrobacter sp.]|nr:zinc ABC transporter substrate-binding protein [Arthrobacter sp.]